MSSSVDEVDKHVLRKYEITQKLGKGAYAVVFKAVEKKTKEVVALKKIFDAFQNQTDAQRTFREIMYLQALQHKVGSDKDEPHPNIIRLRNFMKAENDKDIYLIFDFMETDLHAVIRANILEPVHKQFIVYQTLKALKYCHSGGLLHRDLKPSNLLLNEECILKVADFGLARTVKDAKDAAETNTVLTDYVATRWYRAPEIILGSPSYTKAVDVWALGCIVAEMFIGKPLLPGTSTVDQLTRILDITGRPDATAIDHMESAFAGRMINEDAKKRETNGKTLPPASRQYRFDQLKKLMPPPIDDNVVAMVCDMIDIDPAKRMSVEEALRHAWMAPFTREYDHERSDICSAGQLSISIDDDQKHQVDKYRTTLYDSLKASQKEPSKRSFFFSKRSAR